MKKKLLFGTSCTILLVIGIVLVCGLIKNQNDTRENIESIVQEVNQQTQEEELVFVDRAGNSSENLSGDLLYREFSSGVELENGMNILIEKEQVENSLENAIKIGIIMNGRVYKEILLGETDIKFKIEKNANYVFVAVTADEETIDITSFIKVEILSDGGVITL